MGAIILKISKKDALTWFTFFAALPETEALMPFQQEIVYAVFTQIEEAADARNRLLSADIRHLKTLENRTYFVGEEALFPGGSRSCLLGTGLGAVRKTNKCNLQCKFCYDFGQLNNQPPVGEGMWEIGGTKFYEKDLALLLSIQRKPTGLCYVYLEPFMEIEQYYPVIRKFHEAGIYQHLYTNGTLATEASLRALGEAGLSEIRFNLGATNCADTVLNNIRLAKKYIRAVGVETPMTPEFFTTLLAKKEAVLATGLDFINCAELHLNPNNVGNYTGENMYVSRQGYLSPLWSRELTLKLMKIADDEHWPCVVHDCSNDTKFARDLNLRAKEGGWFGSSSYAREFDRFPYEVFLPVLQDEGFPFLTEEPLPKGYRPGDLTFY